MRFPWSKHVFSHSKCKVGILIILDCQKEYTFVIYSL